MSMTTNRTTAVRKVELNAIYILHLYLFYLNFTRTDTG